MGQPDTPACPEPGPDRHQELPKSMNLAKRRGRRRARPGFTLPTPTESAPEPSTDAFPTADAFPTLDALPAADAFPTADVFPTAAVFPFSPGGTEGTMGCRAGTPKPGTWKDAWLTGKARAGQGCPGPAAHVSFPWQGRSLLADSGRDRSWEQFLREN